MTTVFVHPIGLDHQCWDQLDLAGLRVDLLGHGDRPAPDGDITMASLAEDVVEQIRRSGGREPVDLVGLSLGGAIAQQIALDHPQWVRSLAVACTSSATNREALEQRAQDAEHGGMSGVLSATMSRWFSAAALAVPDHPGVRYAARRLLADDPAVFAATWRALGRHDVRARLGEISVPVTAIAGLDDQASKVQNLADIAEQVADGVLFTIPGPHMLQLETPAALAEVLTVHLERVAQTTG